MIKHKKTLQVQYKSGRTEKLTFASPNEARQMREKLQEQEAITAVQLVE